MSITLVLLAFISASGVDDAPLVDEQRQARDRDSDGDGLLDSQEDLNMSGTVERGETDPHKRDTDGDGASDALERRAGTDPNRSSFNTFPEPMVFDLVRGLDAEPFELEVNALMKLSPKRRGFVLEYAPEIEFALWRGIAVELELPMVQDRIVAVKLAGQLAFSASERFAHGMQVILEGVVDDLTLVTIPSYLLFFRITDRLSVTTITGLELIVDPRTLERHAALLANPSFWYAIAPTVVVGLENNLVLHRDFQTEVLMMPQAHVQLSHHVRVQVGLGAAIENLVQVAPVGAARFIIEL
jgi:hypothetical protein